MSRRKNKRTGLHTEQSPHLATPDEVRERLSSSLLGFVCSSCGWVLIQADRSRARPCPKCETKPMRRYAGAELGELAAEILDHELSIEDPARDAEFIRARIAGATERFMIRKDDWATAEAIASERFKRGKPPRAVVARIYRTIREQRLKPPDPGEIRPTLEALERERRAAERERVKDIKSRKQAEKPRKKKHKKRRP